MKKIIDENNEFISASVKIEGNGKLWNFKNENYLS